MFLRWHLAQTHGSPTHGMWWGPWGPQGDKVRAMKEANKSAAGTHSQEDLDAAVARLKEVSCGACRRWPRLPPYLAAANAAAGFAKSALSNSSSEAPPAARPFRRRLPCFAGLPTVAMCASCRSCSSRRATSRYPSRIWPVVLGASIPARTPLFAPPIQSLQSTCTSTVELT